MVTLTNLVLHYFLLLQVEILSLFQSWQIPKSIPISKIIIPPHHAHWCYYQFINNMFLKNRTPSSSSQEISLIAEVDGHRELSLPVIILVYVFSSQEVSLSATNKRDKKESKTYKVIL